MQKLYYFLLLVIALGCNVQRPAVTVLDTAVRPQTPPYYIEVERGATTGIGAQSYALGVAAGKWLIVGGRINGFHRTGGPDRTFPSKTANQRLLVIDPATGDTATAPLPAAYRYSLGSTNMPFVQDGNMLYCVGGYGSNCPEDRDECYQTFPYLTAIAVDKVIDAVWNRTGADLSDYIRQVKNENMRVTGGILHKLGKDFYLVFGQNYSGLYADARNGVYTEQVRIFSLSETDAALSIANYRALNDPTEATGTASEFHRRDLNVVPAVRPDNTIGLNVYGGVFNASGSAYLHPILIDGLQTQVVTQTSLSMGLYECPHISLFDRATGTNYTSLLGGIGTSYYNEQGRLVRDNLPFNKAITTVIQHNNGDLLEYVQPADRQLPGFLGANALFVPVADLPYVTAQQGIIDLNRLPAGTGRVLLGWMYGGIQATGAQVSGSGGSIASPYAYAVYLVRQ